MKALLYLEEQSAFNEYVARHPRGSVLQTTNWGKLKTLTGWEYCPMAVQSEKGVRKRS